jgi:hypothetical protein
MPTWLVAVGALAIGCSKHVPLAEAAAPLTPPTRLCGTGQGETECRSATTIEQVLRGELELLGMSDTPSGAQGAKLLTVRGESDRGPIVLRAKWRAQSSGDLLNEPRKELAAYAVQKMFLEPSELVAPPTAAQCIPLEDYRKFDPSAEATFPGTECVFGYISYWLESVQSVNQARKAGLFGPGSGIWDANLFARDETYKESVARCNLLTYVINHGDAHDEQFLLEPTKHGLRAYVVDNSIAFRSIKNPMLLLRQDWSNIQVPWLPPRAVEKLRGLIHEDFSRLSTIAVLERDDGELRNVALAREQESDGTSLQWRGELLRIGLTRGEIELVETRVHTLLATQPPPEHPVQNMQ